VSNREKEPITAPYLILCEGESDREFLKRLIEARDLSGFEVRCVDGKDQLRRKLEALKFLARAPFRWGFFYLRRGPRDAAAGAIACA
jgi:hypothetical protein